MGVAASTDGTARLLVGKYEKDVGLCWHWPFCDPAVHGIQELSLQNLQVY